MIFTTQSGKRNRVHIMNVGTQRTWCGRKRMEWEWTHTEMDAWSDVLCLRCTQLLSYAQAKRRAVV